MAASPPRENIHSSSSSSGPEEPIKAIVKTLPRVSFFFYSTDALHQIDSKGRLLPTLQADRENYQSILARLPDQLEDAIRHTPTAWTIPSSSRHIVTKKLRQLPLQLGNLPIILSPTPAPTTIVDKSGRRPSIRRDPIYHPISPTSPMTQQEVRLAFEIFFEATMLLKLFDGTLWVVYPKRMEVPTQTEKMSVIIPNSFGGLDVNITSIKAVKEDPELRILVTDEEAWVRTHDSAGVFVEKEVDVGYGKLYKVSQNQLLFSEDAVIGEEEKWNKTTGMVMGEVFVRQSIKKCKPGSPYAHKGKKDGKKRKDGAALGTTKFSRGVVWRGFTLSGKGELEVLGASAVTAMRNGMVRMTSFVKESLGVKVVS
ncbi:hypothetical protein BJ508DRAFT_313700 [Ascobolus immersus RN42]|uniref:Uncharacterized protein n=1 Tax=Ascobolus immersus RN42 TaxID=1160509 RepID=A0A3N4HV66_ASCIM|nr:hypothetical protein BJ508DRAFT_313700 [Ascobolus immersus RN42]